MDLSSQEGELFISAKARTSAMVSVQCDSCETLVNNGTFYHNMELKTTSYDLCPMCFKSEFLLTALWHGYMYNPPCRWYWQ